MYVRSKTAAAWLDAEQSGFEDNNIRNARTDRRILWADRPWRGKLGNYVAVRLGADQLDVGISRPGRIEWLPAVRCLSEEEARRWIAGGFAGCS